MGGFMDTSKLDQAVLDGLDGRERLKALLRSRAGLTPKEFAVKRGFYIADLSNCMSGARSMAHIRAALADELALAREVVDELIDGDPDPAGEFEKTA